MQREAAGRNLIMSGGALDILRSRSQQGAYKRAGLRLRLINDVCSPEFNEQLMLGNIRAQPRRLYRLARPAPVSSRPQSTAAAPGQHVGPRWRRHSRVMGEGGPPLNLPWHLICRDVRDWLKKHEGREPQLTDKTIQNAVKKIRQVKQWALGNFPNFPNFPRVFSYASHPFSTAHYFEQPNGESDDRGRHT